MDGLQKKQTVRPAYASDHGKKTTKVESHLRISEFESNTDPHWRLFQKKLALRKFIFFSALFFFLISLSYGSFFFWKVYSVSRKISHQENSASFASEMKSAALSLIPSQRTILSGEDKGRVNILLLGAAGEKKPGSNLTDTVMLASIDTQSKKVSLLSLPRDLYVKIPGSASHAKINSLYQIGLRNNQGTELIEKTVSEITGQKIDYYLVVDFDGFTTFIDTLGGVTVNVERNIYDSRYPGPNYSYETFELKKGVQVLDGTTALKYVRERHDDPQGDFGRAKRQQQTIQAVKNKVFSLGTFLDISTLNGLLTTLENNVRTNVTIAEIESFLFLAKKLDTQNISTKVVDAWKADSLLKVSHVYFENARAFILVPKVGSYSQIQDLAENIFDIQKIEKRKEEFAKEAATLRIINESGDPKLAEKVRRVASEALGIKTYQIKTIAGDKIRTKTEISDATNGKKIFTLDELIRITPATISPSTNDPTSTKTDFTLYLGKDLVDIYKYEDVSKEEYDREKDKQVELE
ncbi:MAG TPA: hypothetical protein DCX32_00185 [Candidatus Moranbacteria bacterium]|nr:MAG: hypothetical protein UW87_C0005G0040 [Candidatus Moranbacteria bacterium GW2011_GWC2_45_10]KKT95264.1 MAG: hypothetical protein UW95_C0002G0007 [Parcubacteria group bacterium GW2011_GWC1_45_14]HAV10955.1 hypothetical protein [Candidatus Moranbacteria bacterium]